MRDRLYNAQEGETRTNGAFRNKQLDAQKDVDNGGAPEGGINKDNSRPIADLFPEVTVLFADLVGEQLFVERE